MPRSFGHSFNLADGSRGWLVYQRQKFLLTRFAFKTERRSRHGGARASQPSSSQYPRLDTQIENIQMGDPHLPAFYDMGYMESFRRVEMWRLARVID